MSWEVILEIALGVVQAGKLHKLRICTNSEVAQTQKLHGVVAIPWVINRCSNQFIRPHWKLNLRHTSSRTLESARLASAEDKVRPCVPRLPSCRGDFHYFVVSSFSS